MSCITPFFASFSIIRIFRTYMVQEYTGSQQQTQQGMIQYNPGSREILHAPEELLPCFLGDLMAFREQITSTLARVLS